MTLFVIPMIYNGHMEKIFSLVDCTSFYASCEQIFRPDLKRQPVIVLSNNDGCVVSLTKEAKNLGVTRGIPYFKIRHLINKYKIAVFSSNYELYGDISSRIMHYLKSVSPAIEVYSIDEAFLDWTGIDNPLAYAKKVQNEILKRIGLAVTIGLGPTKTLAKLANTVSKKESIYQGIFALFHPSAHLKLLKSLDVFRIWGIGLQYAQLLQRHQIYTIYDLIQKRDDWIKKKLTIRGLYLVWELRGRAYYELEQEKTSRKTIICSKSFAFPVRSLDHLKEAVACYAAIALEKLRSQQALCASVGLYLTTNYFKTHLPQYSRTLILDFNPSNYPPDIINQAIKGLEKIYRPGYYYKKVAVMLDKIIRDKDLQSSLFEDQQLSSKKKCLLQTVDQLNQKYGRQCLQIGTCATKRVWQMKRERLSPRYTTQWLELQTVKAR